MHAAELACTRESLGLSVKWMSDWLNISERTLKRYEDGTKAIPDDTAESVDILTLSTISVVSELIRDPKCLRRGHVWTTYRTDADAREGGILCAPKAIDGSPDVYLPASWHRSHTARCVDEVGGGIAYYVPKDERE